MQGQQDDASDWYSQVQRKVLPRRRSASLPTADEQPSDADAASADAQPPPRRRGFSLARHQSVPAMSVGKGARRRRKVTFKNMYAPDVVPPPKVESYDELVFNVAGLFHTMSFLHDPEDWGEDPTTGSMSSEDEYYDPEPPLERSVPLMIAEFLHRSAVFLGYPQGDTPWLPGFREDKKFSSNDVKRWRRLAHFDWEAEEREFQRCHRTPPPPSLGRTQSVESNGHTSVMTTLGANFRMRRQDSSVSVDSAESSSSSSVRSHESGKTKFRSAVSGWIRKHRRQRSHENNAALQEQEHEAESADKTGDKKKQHDKHKPVSWLNPPPISSSRDLALLVVIINSCVYCGQFQFRKRDVVRLCNVRI
ncbi:hypothetical protein PF005_g13828 [Phytophthora fragariae]|uniref:Uncharacterized protein n=2 Tax=Phytophthora TaxID=4783 RepID=A0A6A3TU65_9STRA|nr:hypothetical protein PF003_g40757 [Phytophthora fragariae]KAE8986893.1 hypothetical protein PR001_g22473 [Phytophthora rubi]KAE8934672.1 hypothetical protein PF009_g15359 [Phytophthora fragariae]KAE9003410.1 hypothetical protein PF011_g12911 [Phytophthora fragariae]KAE9103839.1 hypothetical protein PF007_g14263 [Phytophthora fragariae]